MKDQYNRTIDYVRISLTDRCNLNCAYCNPEQQKQCSKKAVQPMSDEQIVRLCGLFYQLGVRKVKLTGGEPLLRDNVPDLIGALKETCHMQSVTITTNGVYLKQQLAALVQAGLDGVNISLDTLDEEHFTKITGYPFLHQVLEGIHSALNVPALNVKINCVPLEPYEDDLIRLAALARNRKLSVRFIELMPIGTASGQKGMTKQQILDLLEAEYGPAVLYEKRLGNGPAEYYSFSGFQGKIGFISAMTHTFCKDCNRIRLTADGQLKTCLQYEAGTDLKKAMEAHATDEELLNLIRDAVRRKPKEHQFGSEQKVCGLEKHSMAEIGG